jgi:hypothetical protein
VISGPVAEEAANSVCLKMRRIACGEQRLIAEDATHSACGSNAGIPANLSGRKKLRHPERAFRISARVLFAR